MRNQFHISQILPYWMMLLILTLSHLDDICQFNYDTFQGICTAHSFPVTRSQAKLQKIAIPSLFKRNSATCGPKQKPSVPRDPPAVMA